MQQKNANYVKKLTKFCDVVTYEQHDWEAIFKSITDCTFQDQMSVGCCPDEVLTLCCLLVEQNLH